MEVTASLDLSGIEFVKFHPQELLVSTKQPPVDWWGGSPSNRKLQAGVVCVAVGASKSAMFRTWMHFYYLSSISLLALALGSYVFSRRDREQASLGMSGIRGSSSGKEFANQLTLKYLAS